MKICKTTDCKNEVVRAHSRANNKQFCSPECRQKHYNTVNAVRIKAVRDRLNHAKYNKYEKGKERCIICDGWYWAVCHHVANRHKISERDYKIMLGADHKKGRIPAKLKKLKREQVFENGTVKNLKKGEPTRFKKGDSRAGNYERSKETKLRLSKQFKKT